MSASHNQLIASPHVVLAALGMKSPPAHFVSELQPHEAEEATSWFESRTVKSSTTVRMLSDSVDGASHLRYPPDWTRLEACWPHLLFSKTTRLHGATQRPNVEAGLQDHVLLASQEPVTSNNSMLAGAHKFTAPLMLDVVEAARTVIRCHDGVGYGFPAYSGHNLLDEVV